MSAWVVVRSAERRVAVPVDRVAELVPLPPLLAAPGIVAAVRGVAPHRGRLVPIVHLAAILGDGVPPDAPGTTAVAVAVRGRAVLLEVEDVELTDGIEEPLPHGWRGRWASGAVRPDGALVPVLDLDWLGDRLTRKEPSATA